MEFSQGMRNCCLHILHFHVSLYVRRYLKPWLASRLTAVLRKTSVGVRDKLVGVRLYRQLSTEITEKHVREVCQPFN